MNDILKYEDIFKNILDYKQRLLSLLALVTRGFESSSGIISDVLEQLRSIPIELPCKRTKKGLFAKAQQSISNMEPCFTQNWFVFIQSISPPPGLSEYNASIIKIVIDGLKDIRDEYYNKMENMENQVSEAAQQLKTAEENKDNAYAAYAALCKQLEDVNQKIQSANAGGKPQDVIQKLYAQFGDLKGQYSAVLNEAIHTNHKYNHQRSDYSTTMEAVISCFEDSDKKVFDRLQEISKNLVGPIDEYFKSKETILIATTDLLQKPANHQDFDTYVQNKNLSPVPPNQIEMIQMCPEILPFDIANFVPSEKLFAHELNYFNAKVIKEFKAKKNTECDVSVGQIVSVIKRKGSYSKVNIRETNIVGYVPSKHLEKMHGPSRCLMRVTEDFDTKTGLRARKGEIVVVMSCDEEKADCVNAYYAKGEIPLANLVKI